MSFSVDSNLLGIESGYTRAPYLSPGFGVLLDVGILLGAEARYNIVFNEDVPDAVSLLASVGFAL